MWDEIEERVNQNERENPVPLRTRLLQSIKRSGLTPGEGATKKMVSFVFGVGDHLVWSIESSANTFYLSPQWQEKIHQAGLTSDLRPYQNGLQDGGRHSGLNRAWSFPGQDCIAVRVDNISDFERLLTAIFKRPDDLVLKPEAVTRWIERLRHFFPDFDRFDRPLYEFDESERDYKLETASKLGEELKQAASDQDIENAVHRALSESNLLQWRTYWPMSPKGDADRARLWPALKALLQATSGNPEQHPEAVAAFVRAWGDATGEAQQDAPRQIAEFLLMHLDPEHGIYIRSSLRDELWREAVGSKFPAHASIADTYRDERRFMIAVRRAFEERDLAPRDMIDVQSALWVVHGYESSEYNSITTPPISREAVEAAMDEYESLGPEGFKDAYPQFSTAHDYWVRSTRPRSTTIFSSKPIVAIAMQPDQLSGGWSRKDCAAALLHNSGYIIVDRDDQPVPVPKKRYLLIDADRIRACARNYYIEPARERAEPTVSIRAGTLSNELNLNQAWPNVCQALKGRRFQEYANVPPPLQEGPNASTTTTFTFDLTKNDSRLSKQAGASKMSRDTTNLILYGPPGTGKTYRTALEAVRLCLGDDEAQKLAGNRSNLMDVYRNLVSSERVEFVTFHQSFSYEDFVEGLRPTTGDDEQAEGGEHTERSGGFSLKVHNGIFKRISERARKDTGGSDAEARLDRNKAIFKVALGRRTSQEDRILFGLENELIHTGWGGDIDWSDERFDDFHEILAEWRERKDASASGKEGNTELTYAFRSAMQIGDYVVISDGRDLVRAVGEVVGDYYYDSEAEFHPHRRQVNWLWGGDEDARIDRSRIYAKPFRQQSVYRLDPKAIDWDVLENVVLGKDVTATSENARDHVLIIDEINRANISKVFGELITLLEPDKRLGCENEIRLQLPYSGKPFGVPANLHIIGTMNTADRSIALLDTALRRRFAFKELMPDPTLLSANVDGVNLQKLLTRINERIEYLFDREHQIGHAYFINCKSKADIEAKMRDAIIPLLAEYFYDDWSKIAVVLEGRRAPEEGNFTGRFLDGQRLSLEGLEDHEFESNARLRWSVKPSFDFSEFAAT
ncbi:AAA family ATPase [Henriciella sp.]|uniref:AAA family ATPase n=1 Tax=Henriciella sp. TaxID=1968823 RepID=UPI002635CD04|nr:AAA family ATPase [Henriciella sp.]